MSNYKGILTNKGKELLANATMGNRVNFSHLALGDGNGNTPTLNETRTALVKERHRLTLNSVDISPNNRNQIVCEAIIPTNIGGFTVRELGLFVGNFLVVHSTYPPTYKPRQDEGGAREMVIRIIINVQNADVVALYLDTSLVYATRGWVETNFVNHNEVINNLTSNDTNKPLSAAQGKKLNIEKLAKSGDVMTGALQMPASATSPATSTPFAISYRRIQSHTNIYINANTDNTNADEPVIITSGKGIGSNKADGLAVGSNYLQWLGVNVATVNSNVASATKLHSARTINGVAFDGTANITISDNTKANKTVQFTAGNGLTGGGDLSANRTITLGTPSTINASSTNSLSATSHSHEIAKASTTVAGIVQLNDTLTSTATNQALTAHQGRVLKQHIDTKLASNANAVSASKLATARTINGVAFDGTANISVGLPTFSATINQATLTLQNANDAIGQGGFTVRHLSGTTTNKPDGISHAMMSCVYDSKYASQFAADWRTNKLYSRTLNNGQWTSWKEVAYTDGNVASANKLRTPRTLSMTGDGTWSVSFDGTNNVSGTLTLANTGVRAGSYNSVTVDAKGRVMAGLTQTHGLITATSATGVTNTATNNANTFLNIVASGVGATSSVGSSTQITGTNGISISSDTAGKLIISQAIANNLTDSSATKALSANMGKVLKEQLTALDNAKFDNRGLLHDKDLDTLKSIDHTGIWQQTGNSGATSARHYPMAKAGTLLVLPSAYQGQQLYFPFDEAVIYKRTTNSQGTYGNWMKIGGLTDNLNSTSTTDALTANQGKILKQHIDGKLGNSGTQHLNGVLWVGQSDTWQKITFKDTRTNANRSVDLEINPAYFLDSNTTVSSAEIKFRFNDTARNGNTARYIVFPSINNFNQNVAYHSWVQNGFLAKTANATSASKLQTPRQITLTGAITGSVAFDGSANAIMPTTLTKAVVREYNRTINGTATGQTTNTMQMVGQVVVGADGRITQYFHLKHFRDFWFAREDNAVGYYNNDGITFVIPITLWTAMPNKLLSVNAQVIRSTNPTSSAQYQSEAAEHVLAWDKRKTSNSTSEFFINLSRFRGSSSEHIDLFVIVEGY